MATPALQRLREALPDSHITLLTQEKLADLWRHHPSLNATITFRAGESPWSVARRLQKGAFEAALVLPNSPRAALEAWLARVPQRIGYARPWRTWLLTQPVLPRPGAVRMHKLSAREVSRVIHAAESARQATPRASSYAAHHIHDYLYLAAALGANAEPVAPKLEVTTAEVQEAEKAFLFESGRGGEQSVGGKPLVLLGLNPGAEYGPAKRWPAESFAAAANGISRRVGHGVWLLFGSAIDHDLCEQIARRMEGPAHNLAGKTSLRQLMALLRLCRVLLTNDTGPMHVAAALGTPVIVPFGSTSAELTGPGLPGDERHHLLQSTVPCSPCFRRTCPIDLRCMTSIAVEQVVSSALDALDQAETLRPSKGS